MSSETVLIPFKFPYYWSIVFGTMPSHLRLQRSEEHQQMKNSADVNRKFVAITIAWMTVATTFLVRDIQASISWNPTQFFSMKVVAIFPNDFHCMRLIHNIEIWMVLIMCLKSGPKLKNVIENFNSLGFIGPTRSYAGFNSKWKHLILKQRHLSMMYAFMTVSPIGFELFLLLYETNNLDLQLLSQGTLHCIPLTVNLQFCSLCMLLDFQFDDLNSHTSKRNHNLTPKEVQQISQKHSEICYVTRQVYKIYEWQLLAETTIVTLTVFLYTYYTLNPSNLIWGGYGEVLYCSLWILHYAGRLFTTCMSVSKVIMQAEETRKVVLFMEENDHFINSHDEGNISYPKPPSCYKSDKLELDELLLDNFIHLKVTSFVNRIQNQDIHFDVCGFFHLEGTLIVSVCSWCISFILILLQFRKPT